MGGSLKYDVIVIGASSAGLYAAEILAKNGKRVVLFEQADSVQPTRRTYIITPGIFRVMPEINPKLILHRTTTFHLQADSENSQLPLASPDLTIERSQMILALIKRAKESGVEIHLGAKFLGLITDSDNTQIQIQTSNGEGSYQADYLIGADGLGNSVGRATGLKIFPKVPLLQAEVLLPPDWNPGVTKVWFDIEDTSYFYWLIPESETSGVLGLIADPGTDIRKLLEQFCNKQNIKPINMQSGQAALHSPGLRNEGQIGNLKIMRVGDSAGQVKNSTVGGSVTGFVGAKAAAQAILDDIPYKKSFRTGKRELDIHFLIRQLLSQMDQTDYYQMIEYLNPAILSFLSTNDRDSMRRKFWLLPLLQPRFIPLGIKLLLKWIFFLISHPNNCA